MESKGKRKKGKGKKKKSSKKKWKAIIFILNFKFELI
jgi:hypothetical protein